MPQELSETILPAVRRDANALIGWGVVLMILGLLAILVPMATGLAVSMVVGALLLLAGGVRLIFAFQYRSWGRGSAPFVAGGLSVLGGLILLLQPLWGLAVVAILLAAYFLLEGLAGIALALALKPVEGWGLFLAGGVISLVLAVLLLTGWPSSGAWVVGLLVGLNVLLIGVAVLGLGMAGRSAAGEWADSSP